MTAPRSRAVERLADALQDCFREALDECRRHTDVRLDRQNATLREMRDHMDERLDRQDATLAKQNATLRTFWKQMKGNGRLPIDED